MGILDNSPGAATRRTLRQDRQLLGIASAVAVSPSLPAPPSQTVRRGARGITSHRGSVSPSFRWGFCKGSDGQEHGEVLEQHLAQPLRGSAHSVGLK